jgi:hypothetical protein
LTALAFVSPQPLRRLRRTSPRVFGLASDERLYASNTAIVAHCARHTAIAAGHAEDRLTLDETSNVFHGCLRRKVWAASLDISIEHILGYVPMVWTNANSQLVAIVTHAQLAEVWMRCGNGEFVPIGEFLGKRQVTESLSEQFAEDLGDRTKIGEDWIYRHRMLRANA